MGTYWEDKAGWIKSNLVAMEESDVELKETPYYRKLQMEYEHARQMVERDANMDS